jgi:hypothetical protein
MSRVRGDRFISFFGDLHPSFFGNVVKAMGSPKQGYPVVSRVLERVPGRDPRRTRSSWPGLNNDLRATVHRVERLTPKIVEVVVRAPLAARRFHPGQFYRLQNFETLAGRQTAPRSAWRGSRSRARGWIASRDSCPRSCWRWVGRATSATASSRRTGGA